MSRNVLARDSTKEAAPSPRCGQCAVPPRHWALQKYRDPLCKPNFSTACICCINTEQVQGHVTGWRFILGRGTWKFEHCTWQQV